MIPTRIALISDVSIPTLMRMYLKGLWDHGFRVDRVLQLEPRGKGIRRLARSLVGPRYMARIRGIMGRENRLDAKSPYRDIIDCSEPLDEVLFGNFSIGDYCPRIEYHSLDILNSPSYFQGLMNEGIHTVIYAGWRIVPKNTLNAGVDFIHVHSGVVPYIRGVHGLVWSILIRKKLGYSAIYLDDGVDTGDLIGVDEYDPPMFAIHNFNNDQQYLELFNYIRLSYNYQKRVNTLVRAVKKIVDADYARVGTPQTEECRKYFRALPALIVAAMKRIVRCESE